VVQENIKALYDEWRQLDAEQKKPYEQAALADANRYQREVRS